MECSFSIPTIQAISAVVPERRVLSSEYDSVFGAKQVNKIIKSVGIEERRFVDCNNSYDLAIEAARRITEDDELKREIDVLIFVSQTAPRAVPNVSSGLQHRLNLPTAVATFDLNLGCAGYPYALSVAYSFVQCKQARRVLLINSETLSRITSRSDQSTSLLFADAAAATLIGTDGSESRSSFSLHTDGSGEMAILASNLPDDAMDDKLIKMDGGAVFDFVLREVPSSINKQLEREGLDSEGLDLVFLHQANEFLLKHVATKIKVPHSKLPMSIQKFGNTSSVSIPLTISSYVSCGGSLSNRTCILAGFGSGFSWGSALLRFSNPKIYPIKEIAG